MDDNVKNKLQQQEHLKIVEAVKNMFIQLTDYERLDIMSNYCKHCGCSDPTSKCQCWNDE